jgi:hypothetical protein
MTCIYWLASYPKSGNTWFRAFLKNLRVDRDTPVNINELGDMAIASHRPTFDRFNGVSAVNLLPDEIDRLRPHIYRLEAQYYSGPLFKKVHDAYLSTAEGRPMFPPEVTAGVVYIIRNPFDVAVSYAHHLNCDVNHIITCMGDPAYALCGREDRAYHQLRQRLLSWSMHVLSWVDAPNMRLHVIRYEDMKHRPLDTLTKATRFCGLPDNPERVSRAIRFSAFGVLQAQENTHGFKEKSPKATSFFREGLTGSWRELLGEDDVKTLIRDHRTVMQRFGYLTENDKPVY